MMLVLWVIVWKILREERFIDLFFYENELLKIFFYEDILVKCWLMWCCLIRRGNCYD